MSSSALCAFLMALFVWLIWIVHLVWLLSKRPTVFGRKISPWAGLVGGVFLIIAAFLIGARASKILRVHEIRYSIDAGLREDCIRLLHNWPFKANRIYDFDPEFAKLPTSIKMLKPAYVENDSIDEPDLPPNVGICKDGFGGFAMGVRVFQSDQDMRKYENGHDGGCDLISPGVYFWWRST